MASGYNIGPRIGIEGEAEFRKQIAQINTAYKTMVAEVKAVTAAYGDENNAQAKLEKTSAILEKQITSQREKITLLENAIQKASVKYGENSTEATRLQGVLYDTQATLSGLEKELADTESKLNGAAAGMDEYADQTGAASDATLSFGNVLKANLLSDAIMAGIRKLGDAAKDFASGMVESAAEVQAENAQFTQAFGEMETQARSSLQAVASEAGITATRMQGSYTQVYAFAKTLGADSAQSLDIASRAMAAAADSAAYYDKSIEEVTESLQSFLKGNYENDAALGIAATETTRNTAANEKYAKSFQDLSEAQKVDVLLSMVEAGNKASGALGQAARESDSWANVTGELDEAQRQLQATLGKPVMDKLIPVVQKFTAKIKDAAESGDLERLADGIADAFGWLLDNGDDIVRVVGSIGTGFVAFKAAQKAREIASFAQQLIALGKASGSAASAVAASGAVVGATPWGAIATGIGLAVGAITLVVSSIQAAQSELDKATAQMADDIAAANQQYQETKIEVESAAIAAGEYVNRLRELEESGLNSAAAQREYEMTVEALNELIPELNLTIDEQTGLIEQNIDALEREIEAWKENATAKALQDKFADVLEAQAKVEAELYDAQARYNRLVDEGNSLNEEYNRALTKQTSTKNKLIRAENQFNAALDAGQGNLDDLAAEVTRLQGEYDACTQSVIVAERAVEKNAKAQSDLAGEISDAQGVIESYAGDIQEAEDAMRLYTEGTEAGAGGISALARQVRDLQSRMAALTEEYEAAKAEAQDSLQTQIGLFEEVSTACEISVDEMIAALESQAAAMQNYGENLAAAAKMGINDGLLKSLSDGSVESMQYLQAIVNANDTAVAQLNAAWADKFAAQEYAAGEMAALEVDLEARYAEMTRDTAQFTADLADKISGGLASMSDQVRATMNAFGADIVDGVVAGVNSRSGRFYTAMGNLARTGAKQFTTYFDINSPSGLMEDFGRYIDLGAAKGVDKYADKFTQSMARLAELGERNYDFLAPGATGLYPGQQTTQNLSLGGISVQVNAGNVSDPRQLADMVADRIQSAVTSRMVFYGK